MNPASDTVLALQSPDLLAVRSVSVKSPSEPSRSIFMIRDRSATARRISCSVVFVVCALADLADSIEGRKKGAFSGALGGSFGLFRCCKQRLSRFQKQTGHNSYLDHIQM